MRLTTDWPEPIAAAPSPDVMPGLARWLGAAAIPDTHRPRTDGEWHALSEQLCSHGLAGLALEHAAQRGETFPPLIARCLAHAAALVASNNQRMLCSLERMLKASAGDRVHVLLLKGAPLSLMVYGARNLRPMGDVDLLVKAHELPGMHRALAGAGFQRGMPLLREDFFPKFYYEEEWLSNDTPPARVDLHVRPFRPLRFARIMPDDALFDGARTLYVGSQAALVPRPELMLVHLAVHAAFHGCSRMIWLYDIVRFVSHYRDRLSWDDVVRVANSWSLAWPMLVCFDRVNELFGSVVPDGVIQTLRGTRHRWQDRLVTAQAPKDAASPARHVAVDLLCTPGIGFRASYLRALLSPGESHLSELYSRRHAGWKGVAHIRRAIRALGRLCREAMLVPARLVRGSNSGVESRARGLSRAAL